MPLSLILNGQPKEFALEPGASIADVVDALELKSDRIAVEHNGNIAQREIWGGVAVQSGDRLEVVHFVGGGCVERVDVLYT